MRRWISGDRSLKAEDPWKQYPGTPDGFILDLCAAIRNGIPVTTMTHGVWTWVCFWYPDAYPPKYVRLIPSNTETYLQWEFP